MTTTKTMPKIQFIKVRRECGFNEKPENAKRLIYDYNVVIDGEHRATWKKLSSRSIGYELAANVTGHYAPCYHPEERRTWTLRHVIKARTKDEFQPVTEKALADGRIPTVEGLRELEREHAAEQETKAQAEAQQRADDLCRAAAPALKGALADLLNAQDMMQHQSDYLPGIKRRNLDECKENARRLLKELE